MRIAIVGSGISGLVAAHHLHRRHEIAVFEKDEWLGGHSHTVTVADGADELAIDTGFIVYNERTYPIFTRLLSDLGVATQPSDMSFAVRCRRCRLEWAGSGLAGIFAQKQRLASPAHYRMLLDIVRFNREARRALHDARSAERTLTEFLDARGYSKGFVRHYLLPMGAAIWSSPPGAFGEFPLPILLRFLDNHGLLTIAGQPIWRTVVGGSRQYVRALVAPFADRVRARTPVRSIRRGPRNIEITLEGGATECFDRVFLATHADQALALLEDPSVEERHALSAIPYRANLAVLHHDDSVLPRRHAARASWNVELDDCSDAAAPLVLTYSMNRLQRLSSRREWCVTLNDERRIAPERIRARIPYEHPVYTARIVAAQRALGELGGTRGTYYCGAYLGFGFHEDGARSGLEAARAVENEGRVAA